MMVKKKICCRCDKKILPKERYILLGTYEDEIKDETKIFEEKYYHLKCWRDYMKTMIDDKIEVIRQGLMRNAGMLAGNLMKNMRGMQQ